ncbi:F-type H+-transporting ATPase subunit k, partial [Tremellales sp. Uapishka_1]
MSYTIAGRVIKNEYLALGTMFGAVAIAMGASGGGEKKSTSSGPVPIESDKTVQAGSSEEEALYIRQFVAEAEKEDTPHH